MNKRKSSVFLTSILIISSMTVAFATWDKGHSIFNIGSDRSSSGTYFGELNEYSVGDAELELGSIKEIEVSWHKGDVHIVEYDGDEIIINEDVGSILSDGDKLRYLSKNGKLIIRYSKDLDAKKESDYISKDLTIQLPKKKGLISELKLSTVNSKISINAEYISKLKIDSLNGSVDILGRYDKLEISEASGNVEANLLNCPQNIDTDIINGNFELSIPENKGFVVEYDIKNGDFESDFSLISKDNYAIYKKAKSNINLNTVNGDIKIVKQK